MIRWLILNILKLKGYFKGYRIDYKSNINKYFLNSLNKNSNNKYVNKIENSTIGKLDIGYGCKIINSECTGKIKLGNFVSINGPATRISSHKYEISIGSYSSIASNVVIQEHSHNYNRLTTYYIFSNVFNEKSKSEIISKGAIKIEEDVWIGSNATILSGVTIGRGSIIGAGSVVSKNIPSYSIAVGNPAKVIKKRFTDDVIDEIEKSRWWEKNEEELLKMKYIFEKDSLTVNDFRDKL